MRVVYDRCAGLDVHKKSATARRLVPDGTVAGRRTKGEFEAVVVTAKRVNSLAIRSICSLSPLRPEFYAYFHEEEANR